MTTAATATPTWSAPTVLTTPRHERGLAVGNPPEAVIAQRTKNMSPAKKMAFAVGCPDCNAYPYRFCFGSRQGQILNAFHERRWESAFAAVAEGSSTHQ
jgi:hypothetical protein